METKFLLSFNTSSLYRWWAYVCHVWFNDFQLIIGFISYFFKHAFFLHWDPERLMFLQSICGIKIWVYYGYLVTLSWYLGVTLLLNLSSSFHPLSTLLSRPLAFLLWYCGSLFCYWIIWIMLAYNHTANISYNLLLSYILCWQKHTQKYF